MADPDRSEADAEELTAKITSGLTAIVDAYETVLPLVREARERRAYLALGYVSHAAYLGSVRWRGAVPAAHGPSPRRVGRLIERMATSST
jgi:hypothetical protein